MRGSARPLELHSAIAQRPSAIFWLCAVFIAASPVMVPPPYWAHSTVALTDVTRSTLAMLHVGSSTLWYEASRWIQGWTRVPLESRQKLLLYWAAALCWVVSVFVLRRR